MCCSSVLWTDISNSVHSITIMNLLTVLTCVVVLVGYSRGNKLFMILIDGFRWDYFDHPKLQLKGFPRLIREGVKAEYMIPDFPTNSFPNYRSIETGLHVETHGIVGNFIYDKETEKKFVYTSHENDAIWYQNGESFYITGEKQGKTSALYYWRGCHLAQSGWTTSYCAPYTRKPTVSDIDWAFEDGLRRLREDLTDIVYVYHEKVDHCGHFYGPNSVEVLNAIQDVDKQLDTFLDAVADSGLTDKLDIIIVSDHGMTHLDVLHIINITSVINMDDIHEIVEAGTLSYIWPIEGKEKQVYESLKDFSPNLNVFNKDELRDRWFIKKHKLIPPIFLYAEPGYYIMHPKSKNVYSEDKGGRFLGNHGFDNNKEDMRSIFLAKGPSFKRGYIGKPFPNVNVYQLVCHVTGITPQQHNGTWSNVKDLLVVNESTDRPLPGRGEL